MEGGAQVRPSPAHRPAPPDTPRPHDDRATCCSPRRPVPRAAQKPSALAEWLRARGHGAHLLAVEAAMAEARIPARAIVPLLAGMTPADLAQFIVEALLAERALGNVEALLVANGAGSARKPPPLPAPAAEPPAPPQAETLTVAAPSAQAPPASSATEPEPEPPREDPATAALQQKVETMEGYIRQLEQQLSAQRGAAPSDADVLRQAQRWSHSKALLQKVPLFKPLTDDELWEMACRLQPREFEDGSDIVTYGDRGDAMFIVESGGACAVGPEQDGVRQEYKTYRSGTPENFFGELSLFKDGPRSATVVAQHPTPGERSTCLELRRAEFEVLKERCQTLFKQYNAEYTSRSEKLQAYKELISSTDMFRGLTQQATLRLAAQVNSKKFEDGEAIIHQGDEDGDEMFIVRSNGHH